MKIIDLHHRLGNLIHHSGHNSAHNSAHHSKGSILIWTVMLGLLLTSVFFFFSMRQRMMVAVQRDTAAQQSTKMLLESYADYLQNNPQDISTFNGGKYYGISTIDGIYTKLTQKVDSIENSVDSGVGQKQDYNFTGSIYVEWNRCSDNLKGDLLVNDVLYSQTALPCGVNEKYDDVVGPLSVAGDFTIKAQGAPFFFRIKGAAGTQPIDNQWHMELSKDLDYGKKVTIQRTFQ
jgi:hypothetical protein